MRTIAMILAGGEGTRLTVLSEERAQPAVPFAGKFRIIDFTISNCVNSGIYTVGILTQYRPHSLNDHIGIGKPWDLDRSRGGVRLLQPYQARQGQNWYAGTADAIYQNFNFIHENRADNVVILSGDHIYKMDYRPMIDYHLAKGADLTVGVMPVPLEETHRFGIMMVDDEQRIVQFYEKPKNRDKGNLASMGIYVFNAHTLERRLGEGRPEAPRNDFGKDIIPAMIGAGDNVFAYRFEGYWVDVGTVDAYWTTSLELLGPSPALDLYSDKWPILTKSEERPPVKVGPQAKIVNSMVQDIMMPPLGYMIAGVDFKSAKYILQAKTDTAPEVAISYGNFINLLIEFTIVAFCLFIVIKAMNKLLAAKGSLVPGIPGFGKKD